MSNTSIHGGAAAPGSAVAAIRDEMRRQPEDARASFTAAGPVAERLAEAVRRSVRLLLLGMGGSHAVNRVAEPLYRAAGIDATALPLSEALSAPSPARGQAVTLITSQSGESGEVVAYLNEERDELRFGMTLDAGSTLGRAVPCLVAQGGMERAFAATRSLSVCLAMHARVLEALGLPQDAALNAATRQTPLDIHAAAAALAGVDAIVFSGRGPMCGVAEAGALGILELARIPAFALEGGQLRHGPVEALGSRLGVVFISSADRIADAQSTTSLARVCVAGGSPTIVFDASGLAPDAGASHIGFPAASGIAAAITMLPTLQSLMIAVASARVADVGAPVRSSKVTRDL